MIEEKERKVARSGGTVAVYITKEIKAYFKAGESIIVSEEVKGKNLVIVVRKLLFKFDLEDLLYIMDKSMNDGNQEDIKEHFKRTGNS